MSKRGLKAVSLALGMSGIISLMVFMSVAASGGAILSVPLSPVSMAYAQSPGTQLRFSVVPERSEARYRVREQLAGINFPSDAVGTTNAVEGRISLDAQGHVLTNDSRLTVDLRRLQSDKDRRDNYIRRNTLETDRYPMAVFVPTEVRGLPFPSPDRQRII